MKTWLTLFLLLALTCVAIAESAIFGWHAFAGATPGIGVIQKAILDGPSERNTVPDTKGSFSCEYIFKKGWGTELKALHLLKAKPDGTLGTNAVPFEIVSTGPDRDPVFTKTIFKTESVDFDEGDTFVMVFKTNKRTEMVFARIARKFIPM
jgi:hypothetical protein